MKFSLAKLTRNQSVETLIVFAFQADTKSSEKKTSRKTTNKPSATAHGVAADVQNAISSLCQEHVFSGGSGEVSFARGICIGGARHLLVVGLGTESKVNSETIRGACGSAYSCLKANKITSATIETDSILPFAKDAFTLAETMVQGFELASYSSELYRAKPSDDIPSPERIEFSFSAAAPAGFDRGMKTGQTLAECVNFSRSLGDKPGNRMTPTILADETKKAARGSTLKVTVWGRERILREKMGSFLSVSLGSTQEPKFIVMEYRGAGKKKPICLVGKGLTFDSGGISIKPAQGMEDMKYDMCGGANVIGAMLAIARLKLKVNAIAYVPATENMPGPAANKPGDIVTARNGKTIEVNNTDAEGRLILADALVYACEQKPAFILDAATLTGAIVVALGNFHTGYFCGDEDLNAQIQEAAERSGESLWRMPTGKDHLKDMRGTYADLSNISSGKGAGSGTAAAFLSEFVENDIPYAHFDIAGTAWHLGGRVSYCPKKGASGVIVRTFVEVARGFEGRD